MKILLMLILLIKLSQPSLSQNAVGIIAGAVTNQNNQPVSGATISVKLHNDTLVLKQAVSNKTGRFEFDAVGDGSYVLTISAIGHHKYLSAPLTIDADHKRIQLPVIVLSSGAAAELKEVIVEAKRPMIEHQLDKTVVNVQSMISAAASNTLEVLEKIPGVSVGLNGDISLNGRGGVLVLIDGRATYMSAPDLAAYLKSVPGSILEKIELMDNPPARYDAGGNAIINIKLKKNRDEGVTGNVSLGYSQGTYARHNDAVSLNYHYNKFNVYTNVGLNKEKNFNIDEYNRKFYNEQGQLSSMVDLRNDQTFRNSGMNVNVGMEYLLSTQTTIGGNLNINRGVRKSMLDYNSQRFDHHHELQQLSSGSTTGNDERRNLSGNINMLHKIGKNKELSAEINMLNYRAAGNRMLQNFYYTPARDLDSADRFFYDLPAHVKIYVAKADFIQTFKGKAKLEAGVKSSIISNSNVNDYYTVEGESKNIDLSRSNRFNYDERIHSAYVSVEKKWDRFGAHLGLRVENTATNGGQPANERSTFKKNYTNLFPGLFLNYKLDTVGKNSLGFLITRRINRPNYHLLNPFLVFRDQYSYASGNPSLGPQFQNRFELKFQHRQWLTMGLSYNRFSNLIFETTEAVDNIFITKPNNVAKGYMLLLNTSFNVQVQKWWQLNTTLRLSHLGLNGMAYTEVLNPSTNVARLELINFFKISPTVNAELGGYYASRDLNGQSITSAFYRVNAGIQKKFLRDKATIRISCEDIFHSWIFRNRSFSLRQAEYYQTSFSDSQRFGVAFTYRFGNENLARKRKHRNSASDDEKGRIQ